MNSVFKSQNIGASRFFWHDLFESFPRFFCQRGQLKFPSFFRVLTQVIVTLNFPLFFKINYFLFISLLSDMRTACSNADTIYFSLNSFQSFPDTNSSIKKPSNSVLNIYHNSIIARNDIQLHSDCLGNSKDLFGLSELKRLKKSNGFFQISDNNHPRHISPVMSMVTKHTHAKLNDVLNPESGDSNGSVTETLLTSKPLSCPRWRRVLLKVSGEALSGDGKANIDSKITSSIAREVAAITRLGVEVGIVVGGGNFFRGASWAGESGLDRASADQIGMMATVMNAIFLQGALESIGIPTRVQTAFRIAEIAEPYIRRRAIRHLEKGRVVIFAAGTGNPFFTTDTAAALRAAEINAEVVLKGTNVDGVYDSDPKTNQNAILYQHLSHREVTIKELNVMDATAITLCSENNIPIVVFNLNTSGNITKALGGESIGTLIDNNEWY